MSAAAAAAAATTTPPPATTLAPRATLVSSVPLELLLNELVDHALRSCDDSTREGREAMATRLESTGYDVGRRYAER